MMKSLKLSISIFKNNRLFSYALIVIYTLIFSLMLMLCFFSQSIDSTFDSFLDDYGMADGTIVTALSPQSIREEMEKEEGVEKVCGGLVFDLNTKLEGGQYYTLRYISLSEDSLLRLYDVNKKSDVTIKDNLVAVSSAFAKANNLNEGSVIEIYGQTLTITHIVSSPQTICTARNATTWYEFDSFGYIYVSTQIMTDLTGLNGYSNQFQIYFEEGANQQQIFDRPVFDKRTEVLSKSLFTGSLVEKQIEAGIEGTKAAVTYLPSLIVLIGLLFSTLFVSQIIRNSEKMISLLKVLGYSNIKVTLIFVFYSMYLSVVATIAGIGLGYLMLKGMLTIYKNVYDLPQIVINGKLSVLIIIILLVQLLGIVSCVLCSSLITKTDPMLVGKKNEFRADELPSFLNAISHDSFDKITGITIYRNRRRLFLSILCSVACFVLSFCALSLYISKNDGIDALFKDKMAVDAVIYGNDDALKTISEFSEIEASENRISFCLEYEDETMRVETLIVNSKLENVYDTDYQTIHLQTGEIALEEGFARRHQLTIGDTVCIDKKEFEVVSLVREYLYPVMYICHEDGVSMGYKDNALNVVLKEDTLKTDFSEKLSNVPGYEYSVDMDCREDNVRTTLNQLDTPCIFFIAFALITGLIIVANMNLMSIQERKREYATMLTLGVGRWRFFKMSFAEAMIQFFFTCLIAGPISVPITSFLLRNMSSFSQEYVLEKPLIIGAMTMILIFVYVVVGVFVTNITIFKMNVLHVLASKE